MLIKHGAYYLLAKGLPSIASFLSVAIFTHLMTPKDYGIYSLVITCAYGVSLLTYQWQRRVVSRWLPTYKSIHDRQNFLGITAWTFATTTIVISLISAIGTYISWGQPWTYPLIIGCLLSISLSWFELQLTLASTQHQPLTYGKLLGFKSVSALIIGILLIHYGYGAIGALLGLAISSLISSFIFARGYWAGVKATPPAHNEIRENLAYGLPIALTLSLTWLVESSDRLMIAAFLDAKSVGQYAVGYDLATYSIVMVLSIVSIPAFALIVSAMEKDDQQATQKTLIDNGELISSLSLSGALVITILAPSIAYTIVGESFAKSTEKILPVIAFAAAIGGIKTFHFDLAFQLAKNTKPLIASVLAAAIINVALNIIFIPIWGINGSAWATVAAMLVGTFISYYLGRGVFKLPPITPIMARSALVALASGITAILCQKSFGIGTYSLAASLFISGIAFLVMSASINLAGAATPLKKLKDKAIKK